MIKDKNLILNPLRARSVMWAQMKSLLSNTSDHFYCCLDGDISFERQGKNLAMSHVIPINMWNKRATSIAYLFPDLTDGEKAAFEKLERSFHGFRQ